MSTGMTDNKPPRVDEIPMLVVHNFLTIVPTGMALFAGWEVVQPWLGRQPALYGSWLDRALDGARFGFLPAVIYAAVVSTVIAIGVAIRGRGK
jgi:ABC-type transporter Mla maintaining outer membrane lipid asymmetry permease subunit MlaE